MISLRVFTHPTCATCPMAIRLASEIAEEEPDVELHIVSLGSARGRETAKEMQVLSVPTLFVGTVRFVGVPSREAVLKAIEQERVASDS